MSSTSSASLKKRYTFGEVRIAAWRDPSLSIHPARSGLKPPLVSPENAARPFLPRYKVKYDIPEPTDDEDEGKEDSTNAGNDDLDAGTIDPPLDEADTGIEDRPEQEAAALNPDADGSQGVDGEAGNSAVSDSASAEPPISPDEVKASPSEPVVEEGPAVEAVEEVGSVVDEPVAEEPLPEAATPDDPDMISKDSPPDAATPAEAEPHKEAPLPGEDIPPVTDGAVTPEDGGDERKVSFAPGTPDPAPRKKKAPKGAKGKKKKIVFPIDEPLPDVEAPADVELAAPLVPPADPEPPVVAEEKYVGVGEGEAPSEAVDPPIEMAAEEPALDDLPAPVAVEEAAATIEETDTTVPAEAPEHPAEPTIAEEPPPDDNTVFTEAAPDPSPEPQADSPRPPTPLDLPPADPPKKKSSKTSKDKTKKKSSKSKDKAASIAVPAGLGIDLAPPIPSLEDILKDLGPPPPGHFPDPEDDVVLVEPVVEDVVEAEAVDEVVAEPVPEPIEDKNVADADIPPEDTPAADAKDIGDAADNPDTSVVPEETSNGSVPEEAVADPEPATIVTEGLDDQPVDEVVSPADSGVEIEKDGESVGDEAVEAIEGEKADDSGEVEEVVEVIERMVGETGPPADDLEDEAASNEPEPEAEADVVVEEEGVQDDKIDEEISALKPSSEVAEVDKDVAAVDDGIAADEAPAAEPATEPVAEPAAIEQNDDGGAAEDGADRAVVDEEPADDTVDGDAPPSGGLVEPETAPDEVPTEDTPPAGEEPSGDAPPLNDDPVDDEPAAPVEETPPSPNLSKTSSGGSRKHRDHWERKHADSPLNKVLVDDKVLERPRSSKGSSKVDTKIRTRSSKTHRSTTTEEDEERRRRRRERKAEEAAKAAQEEKRLREEERERRIRREERKAEKLEEKARQIREEARANAEKSLESRPRSRRDQGTTKDRPRSARDVTLTLPTFAVPTLTKPPSSSSRHESRPSSKRGQTESRAERVVEEVRPMSSSGGRSHRSRHSHGREEGGEKRERVERKGQHGERRERKGEGRREEKQGFFGGLFRRS